MLLFVSARSETAAEEVCAVLRSPRVQPQQNPSAQGSDGSPPGAWGSAHLSFPHIAAGAAGPGMQEVGVHLGSCGQDSPGMLGAVGGCKPTQ